MKDQIIISKDRTTIAYKSVGSGPSVIVIPGVLSLAQDFAAFADALGETFTVHTIERRGRGESGPQGTDYSITQECQDVRMLQAQTQADYLFGHSYGGLIALETARNNCGLKKVAVYEPGVSVDGSMPVTWAANYENLLAQNKPLDAFVDFSIAVGPARAQKTPRWLMKVLLPLMMKRHDLQQKLGLLESNLREHQEIARLDTTFANYREISVPVLLLHGGKSDLSWVASALAKLSRTLPISETKTFPNLNHFGPDQTGPREVAEAVREYFQE